MASGSRSRELSPVRWRIYELLRRRRKPMTIDFEELVAYCEVSLTTISLHLDGKRRNARVQEAVARFYDVEPRSLFGDWYTGHAVAVA